MTFEYIMTKIHQTKSIQKISYALDQCPEQSLSSALKINNVQPQLLQFLLLTDNDLLWSVLETTDHMLELGTSICFNKSIDQNSSRDVNLSGFRQVLYDPAAFLISYS